MIISDPFGSHEAGNDHQGIPSCQVDHFATEKKNCKKPQSFIIMCQYRKDKHVEKNAGNDFVDVIKSTNKHNIVLMTR